jgi:hypothetical protein
LVWPRSFFLLLETKNGQHLAIGEKHCADVHAKVTKNSAINMKSRKSIAFVCLLIANLIVPGALAATSASTPLTYANIVSLFKAAKFRATEVQPRCTIFFEGEWKNRNVYDYCVIMVENSDRDIQITFYLTDAHEMNWVTEFLDSPFFARSEVEHLFQLRQRCTRAKCGTLPRRFSSLAAAACGAFRVQLHTYSRPSLNNFYGRHENTIL